MMALHTLIEYQPSDKSINYLSLGINLGIFVLILIGSIILLTKLKFDTSGYKLLFVFYTLFWFPLMLVRSYRGTMNNDLEVDKNLMWVPLSIYGLVGIGLRPLFDYLGTMFRSRKKIVYIALGLQIVSFIPLVAYPSFATNVIQAAGVGIGASCIGTFSLWFNEQHAKTKPFLTISILSLPPLLADFLASPIQSIIRTLSPYGNSSEWPTQHADPRFTSIMWMIALVVIVINCVVGFFLKENPQVVGLTKEQKKQIISSKWDWVILVGIILVGASIDFTKFAISGSIATSTIQEIGGGPGVTKHFEGYISAVFSTFQLAGGILMGLVGSKYFSKSLIYIFGASFFLLYSGSMIAIVQQDYGTLHGAIEYLVIQALSGFGYGVLYNLLIAHVLSLGFKTRRFSPLGLYQSFAAASIAAGSFFTTALKTWLKGSYEFNTQIIQITLICVTIFMGFVYYFINYVASGFKHKVLWTYNRAGNLVQ